MLCAALFCRSVAAQTENYWPQDDLTIHVYAPAGSDADYVSRLLAGRLMRIYGRSVTVDNQPDKSGPDSTKVFSNNDQPQSTIYVVQTYSDSKSLFKADNSQATDDSASDTEDLGYIPLDATVSLPQFLVAMPDQKSDDPIDIKHMASRSGSNSLTLGLDKNMASDAFRQLLASKIPGEPSIKTFDRSADALNALLGHKVDLALARPSALVPLLETKQIALVGVTSGIDYRGASSDSTPPLDLGAADHELKIMFLISDKLPEDTYSQINTTFKRFFSEAIIRQKLESQFMVLPAATSAEIDSQKHSE